MAPFISVIHTLQCVAEQVILAPLSQEREFSYLLCVPHSSHLPCWNTEFSVNASANDNKKSSQEKQPSFNVSKIVQNIKHI